MQKIERYINLSKREKAIVFAGLVFVGLFILIAGIITPLMSYRGDLNTSIKSKDAQLQRIYELSSGIKTSEKVSSAVRSAPDTGYTLFGFLEELASQLGVNERIEYMKPISDAGDSSKESVEVKIRGIHQEDLIGLLYGIESYKRPLRIKRLNVRRVERDKTIDVTFQVVHYG
jgi:type II secretory pathway component PulM